jgi:hypothetical protein
MPKPSPRTVQTVMRALARAIDDLELPAVEKIANESQADPFEVLIATLLSAQTRDAVLAMARSLGYSGPSAAGRSLRRGMSGTVGVLLTERLPYAFNDPGAIAFLHGLATELAEARRALQLIPGDGEFLPAHSRWSGGRSSTPS